MTKSVKAFQSYRHLKLPTLGTSGQKLSCSWSNNRDIEEKINSVFIGCNGKATTLGRPQTSTMVASAQISTEIDPPRRLYKEAWFWARGQSGSSYCMRNTYRQ